MRRTEKCEKDVSERSTQRTSNLIAARGLGGLAVEVEDPVDAGEIGLLRKGEGGQEAEEDEKEGRGTHGEV